MIALALALALAADSPTARLAFEPAQAALGQPVALVLEVVEPPGGAAPDATPAALAAASLAPEVDPSWVVFGSERALASPAEAARGVARRVWRIASLEPGPRRAPEAFRAALEAAGVVLVGLEPVLEVEGVLEQGEDAPRGLRGFPDDLALAGAAPGRSWLGWPLAAALSPLALALGAFASRRGARAGGPTRAGVPEELARLRAAARAGESRGALFELSHLVRRAVDERGARGGARAGLTDEEWLARAREDGDLAPAAAEELRELLVRLAAIKYGGERLSPWGTDELFGAVEHALLGRLPEARA